MTTPPLRRLLPQVQRRVRDLWDAARVGFPDQAGEIHVRVWRSAAHQPFPGDLSRERSRRIPLHVPGAHNVLNATAAIAVGIGLDIPAEQIRSALGNFRGRGPALSAQGQGCGVSVIDDYGHHPTEIRATLAAARQCGFRQDPRDLPAASLHPHSRSDG